MRGQLEFIAILGVIVVIVVVGLYALQTNVIPEATGGADTRTVQDSVSNFIREAAYSTLRNVSENGGYLEPQHSGVFFMGREVPYWMKDGQLNAPDVKASIITGIGAYIDENKDAFASSISGKRVSFGRPQVSVNVLENQLSITVSMPTTVNNASVPQPYRVSVPTEIGDAIDFSRDFAAQQSQKRYFEYFLLSAMLMSPYDGAAQVVPTFIFLTNCGDFVLKSHADVAPHVEETIKSTLARTYMPDKYRMNEEHSASSLKWAIPELSGKNHIGLNVSFDVPDGFAVSYANMQLSPDPVLAFAEPVPMTGLCQSEPILVKYSIRFPAIVRVRDALTGNVMNFAVDVFVDDNAPGAWGSSSNYSSIKAAICNSPQCTANVMVRDSGGSPVAYAGVSYMGCSIGQTGADGTLSARAPCGYGPLKVYKGGYDVFSSGMGAAETANATVTLRKMPVFSAHLYEVVVEKAGGEFAKNGSSYRVSAAGLGENNLPGVNPINSFKARPVRAYLRFQSVETGKIYERIFDSRTATVNGIPEGEYIVSGALMSPGGQLYGAMSAEFRVDGSDIYIYLPYSYEYSMLPECRIDPDDVRACEENINMGAVLSGVLEKCGMGPVQTSEYDAASLPCDKNFGEL